jgi:hypothetical protein
VAEDAAEQRGDPDRAADVAAEADGRDAGADGGAFASG